MTASTTAWLDPAPEPIAVGAGAAVLLRGGFTWDDAAGGSRPWPWLEVGRQTIPLRAALLPRHGGTGRFWAIAELSPQTGADLDLALVVPQRTGAPLWIALGVLPTRLDPLGDVRQRPAGTAAVAVCMATYEPDPALFQRQVRSLRDQTHPSWHAIVSDDASSTEGRAAITAAIDGDDRFTVLWNRHRLGSYLNFERAVAAAPSSTRLIAFCDQDDEWHRDKLTRMEAALGAAPAADLICCDARIVDPAGLTISETFWTTRRHLPSDLRSITVANSVPGCLSLWDARLRSLVLPFPPGFETLHHDGWVAAVAAAGAGLRRIPERLVDHVQHTGNVLGHQGAVDRRIGRLGRRDLIALAIAPVRRREIAALQIDAAIRPEVLARTIRLRSRNESSVSRRTIAHAARDDERVDRLAQHAWRALVAQLRGGLPGTELSVARGLLAARLAARGR